MKKYLRMAILLLIILSVWEAVAEWHNAILKLIWNFMKFSSPVPNWRSLSSPKEIIILLPQELKEKTVLLALNQTLLHCLTAFFIAWFCGILFAQVLVSSRKWREATLPLLQGISGVPPVMFLPILLILLGLDSKSVVALAAFGAVLSIILICYEAQSKLSLEFKYMLYYLGYSNFGVWLWELSTLSNNIYTASREGLRWSLILSIVGEMHGSVAGGLGAYVDSARSNQNYAVVYIGVLVCGILSAILKLGLKLLSHKLHTVIKRLLLGRSYIHLLSTKKGYSYGS